MTSNIKAVWEQATPDERKQGSEWYYHAHTQAVELGRRYDVDYRRVAGIISALSPNQPWIRNIRTADELLSGKREGLPAYPVSVDKAVRILEHGNPLEVLSGNKTRSFYRNIAHPATSQAVTIDGHAWSITQGKRMTLQSAPDLNRAGRYEQAAGEYTSLAGEIGIQPHQLQATTWLTWRRIHLGDNPKTRFHVGAN